uniref:Angiotensin-converting enzyme n=1 Tax=Cyprinus carpio TaxID=7962 RepID=A0A8C1T835_CYPCA
MCIFQERGRAGLNWHLKEPPVIALLVLLTLISTSAALKPEWKPGDYPMTEAGAERFVSDYNSTAEEVFYFSTEASWNYNTNLTKHNSQLQVAASLEEQAFTEAWGQKAKATFNDSLMETFNNPDLKKIIKDISVLGSANLPTAEREKCKCLQYNKRIVFQIGLRFEA